MTTNQILDPSFTMPRNYADLVKVYRQLARTADKRLIQLEALSHQEGYRHVKAWAYARAQYDIKYWGGNSRFNTAPPKGYQQLTGKVNDIIHFLKSPTSTKRGITSTYKSRADTINKKYGTNFTWEDLANFFESEMWRKMADAYGSGTALEMIGVMQKNEDEIVNAINENRDTVVRVDDDDLLSDLLNDALSDYGDDIKDILFG